MISEEDRLAYLRKRKAKRIRRARNDIIFCTLMFGYLISLLSVVPWVLNSVFWFYYGLVINAIFFPIWLYIWRKFWRYYYKVKEEALP